MKNNIIDFEKAKEKMRKAYEIKIVIEDSEPETWRKLKIPVGISFNDLAAIIELAFDWSGFHLYCFEIEAENGKKIIIEQPYEEDLLEIEEHERLLDSEKVKIEEYFKKYKKIKFIYDFGENWIHDIYIEKEIEELLLSPICIEARMEPYREDAGNVYENYCEEERKKNINIEELNKILKKYKELANTIYDRDMF